MNISTGIESLKTNNRQTNNNETSQTYGVAAKISLLIGFHSDRGMYKLHTSDIEINKMTEERTNYIHVI